MSQYLLCNYDSQYWIDIDPSVFGIKVKLMHPNYPSQSYSWPWRDDGCWEPHTDVATTTPSLSSASGRQYHISPNDIEVIENLIQF